VSGASQSSVVSPRSSGDFAEALSEAASAGRSVRFIGGATKLLWGAGEYAADVDISTSGLHELREHNAGDLTAVVDAGLPLAELQSVVAGADQMLALDPPLGEDDAATVGGIVAAGDSGPLRHRYGSARDLVVGMRVALSDGTVAQSGGKVIKNVAGYDLSKLFTGSHGTLGAILELSLRLHPLPPSTATALGRGADPGALAAACAEVAHARLELQSLDLRREGGEGVVMARFGGAAAGEPARDVAGLLERHGLDTEVVEDDDELWAVQRAAQRSHEGTVVKVGGVQAQLADLMGAADALGATLVARAGLGLAWVTLPAGAAAAGVERLRSSLSPAPCVVLDCPAAEREGIDGWGPQDPGALALMRRVKERFDPAGACAPGSYVGGI
jgi:glycolate dehydrogenase FAD-binding subunit